MNQLNTAYITQSLFQNVTILIGEPVDYTDDLKRMQNLNKTPVIIAIL
jgi:hypothetical protein